MTQDVSANTEAKAEFDAVLREALAGMGLDLLAEQRAAMWAHLELVLAANRQFNLTRITSLADAAVKHYADSLSLLLVPEVAAADRLRLLDVGTGAGFPAVPLAIARLAWRITAIDGTGKKARFVGEAAATLGLKHVRAVHARAADLARREAGQYDVVMLRAVAKLDEGIGEAHRLVKPNGLLVFYKTAAMDAAEWERGQAAAAAHGLQMLDSVDVDVPSPQEVMHRRLVCLRSSGRPPWRPGTGETRLDRARRGPMPH